MRSDNTWKTLQQDAPEPNCPVKSQNSWQKACLQSSYLSSTSRVLLPALHITPLSLGLSCCNHPWGYPAKRWTEAGRRSLLPPSLCWRIIFSPYHLIIWFMACPSNYSISTTEKAACFGCEENEYTEKRWKYLNHSGCQGLWTAKLWLD